MRNLKSERGSVATLVIVTVLFFVAILSSAYMIVATLRKSQLKNQLSVKATYEKDLDRVDEIVAELEKVPQVEIDTIAEENGTIDGKKPNYKNPIIPEGYKPIDTETSEWGDGNSSPTQDSVDHGLVIRDDSNNEWVWIPVPDVTVMCDTSNQTEYTLCGTSGETSVKTKLYSKSEIISGQTRTTPGTTTDPYYHEPDLVIGSDSASFDAQEKHYKTILGFDSKEKMAEAFVADYKKMIESIKTYGGFYIGRYELSDAGVQKDKPTLTDTDWYHLYNACKDTKLQASDKVKTQMIWGCQWDVTMNWLISSGAKTSDGVNKNSSTWGNYEDSTENAKVTVTEEDGTTTNKYGRKQNTGYSEYWKANNIYDLAGNCFEWTQEAYSTNSRAYRGGYCDVPGSRFPASYRDAGNPADSVYGLRFSSHFNNKVTLDSRA